MKHSDLSASDWLLVHVEIVDAALKLPKSGKFRPVYNATSWDFDDLYRAAKRDALYSKVKVEKIIQEKRDSRKWPRGQFEAKFWLQARWDMAVLLTKELAHDAGGLASSEIPTKTFKEAMQWLIFEKWDTLLVDFWLKDNLDEYVFFESYGTLPEDEDEFNQWIHRVRNGDYLNHE